MAVRRASRLGESNVYRGVAGWWGGLIGVSVRRGGFCRMALCLSDLRSKS